MQFILPKKYWQKALEACHDDVGHLGIERTLSLLCDRFYWPNMAQDVQIYVKSCPRWLRFKRANLNPIEATRPIELVHIDFLTIEAPKNSKKPEGCQYPHSDRPLYSVCPGLCNPKSKG